MAASYLYRFFKGSWGIWVKITAETVPFAAFGALAYKVEQGLFLSVAKQAGMLPDGLPYLPLGLHLIAPQMQPILTETGPLVIHVLEVELVITEYQPEGIAYALAGWMIQEFDLRDDVPSVHFDPVKNHYLFALPALTSQDEEFARQNQWEFLL